MELLIGYNQSKFMDLETAFSGFRGNYLERRYQYKSYLFDSIAGSRGLTKLSQFINQIV